MPNTVNLREVTDRVLGMIPPSTPIPRRRRGQRRGIAAALMATSGLATLLSVGLWIAGHGRAGLEVFGGSVLLLLFVLRLL